MTTNEIYHKNITCKNYFMKIFELKEFYFNTLLTGNVVIITSFLFKISTRILNSNFCFTYSQTFCDIINQTLLLNMSGRYFE